MPSYTPPIKDFLFLFYEVFKIDRTNIPGFSELNEDLVKPILIEAGKLASEVLSPLNTIGDTQGCKLENGTVITPDGFKEAFKALCDAEWPRLNCENKYDGQGLPLTLTTSVGEIFASANIALFIYQALTHGVYSTILMHGSEEQKNAYLPKIVKCEWTGTMNLTEPQCGTDLNLIKTKAIPNGDGSFKITGQKIFISAGDHDLAENIIHLVLAKIPGSPDGVKGISLFIVPKFLVEKDGTLGQRNSLSVGKLEKKMGIHGNATCVMNYDEAHGFLLGEENKGLRAMFTMMNEARLGVGIQGLSQAEIAYQNAKEYAKQRLQGIAISNRKLSQKETDPIIVHPDIRRMLMEQKSFIESARAFCIWSSLLIDRGVLLKDGDASSLATLLVPVVKAFLSDKGFESTINAQQIFGGHGYIEDYGMTQFARDARIAMIYEGANGIQAIDLVGRKLLIDGGKHVVGLVKLIDNFIIENKANEKLNTDFLNPLKSSLEDLKKALDYFMENGLKDPNSALTGATDFLHLFGHLVLGFMWSQMAKVSFEKIEDSNSDLTFFKTKLTTGKFYMHYTLPETAMRLARIRCEQKLFMELDQELF